jgi:hypothetical protein
MSARTLDAIIVPASRPARYLDHAITLAQAADCRLVVVCSREARADDVNRLLASRSLSQAVVIDLPSSYSHRWLDFATSCPDEIRRLPEACAARDTDLSMKRNLGLIVARMVGWDRVFFMDDDITGVEFHDLCRTVGMLGQQYYSVGMQVNYFPDNSVVCHAHRETGESQDVFVSGSVLAIDCTATFGFFPDVYNEDWLFFYNDTVEGRLACSGLPAAQLAYDPFDSPDRAAGQEFGDVLAEGLYALLHNNRSAAYATRGYWLDFLEARRVFLDAITVRADKARPEVRQKMLASVAAARECSAQIEPSLCEHYVQLWRKDLSRWEQTLKELPRVGLVEKALSELGLALAVGETGSNESHRGVTTTKIRRVIFDGGAAHDRTATPEPVSTSNATTLNHLPGDHADLAQLGVLASTHQAQQLKKILPVGNMPAVGRGKKLTAMGRAVGVGVLVMVGVAGVVGAVVVVFALTWP